MRRLPPSARRLILLMALIGAAALFLVGPPAAAAEEALAFSDRVETLTQRNLALIEQRLQERLKKDERGAGEAWRDRLIRLSMWGPLARLTQGTLEALGDSDAARQALFFLMPLVRWMSAPFIFPVETDSKDAAKEAAQVFALIAQLRKTGMGVSLDNVGDASLSPANALRYRAYYQTLIDSFIHDGSAPELNLSLKLSALAHDLDAAVRQPDSPEAKAKRQEVKQALKDLLRAAAKGPGKRIFLRIDMEERLYKAMTLQTFREVVEEHADIVRNPDGGLRLGVVIQAYLRDAAKDMQDLVAWARRQGVRVPIRLVKGAYLEHERDEARKRGRRSPVWSFKPSTDANYEGLSAFMLLNLDAIQPAFATHNIRSLAHVLALAEALRLPGDAFELQMLYGMGDPIKRVIIEMGYAMREYVPAGSLARGLKYAGRRFSELASGDNALARTMRGDFTSVDGAAPVFQGEEDSADGQLTLELVNGSLARP